MARKPAPAPAWMSKKDDTKTDPVEATKAAANGQAPKDGRSARATGRTKQFATRVTEDLYKRYKVAAARDGLKLCELLESAIDAYEEQR